MITIRIILSLFTLIFLLTGIAGTIIIFIFHNTNQDLAIKGTWMLLGYLGGVTTFFISLIWFSKISS
jgi:hypothetical protein